MLGWLLALLGAILVIRSFAIAGEAIERIKFRPLLALLGCVLFFAVTINPLGSSFR